MVIPSDGDAPVKLALKTLGSLDGVLKNPGKRLLIFQCYGGTHSSVTAASIYLNLLPRDRVPTNRELLRLPYFDRVNNDEVGPLRFMGRDRHGASVYILGSRQWRKEIKILLQEILLLLPVPSAGVILMGCLTRLNWLARIGGFISRRLGLTSIGRPLVCYGIRLNYRHFIRHVELLENRPELFTLMSN